MTTIEKIQKQLETSDLPVAKSFHIGDHFKVLIFGFKKGMRMKDHTAYHPTKLLVLSGTVIYHQEKRETRMEQYDEIDIPAEIEHSVGALEDSMILLTQG